MGGRVATALDYEPTPPWTGALDDIVAAGGSLPNAAFSTALQLRAAYSGYLLRVRRASDDTTLDIGAVDHALDVSTLAAHCGASDGFVTVIYDQSGNARDISQSTTTLQAKIYDGATTSVLKSGTLPAAAFGTAGMRYTRSDSAGITGSSAVTHAYFADYAQTSNRAIVVSVGNSTDNQLFGAGCRLGGQFNFFGFSSDRIFTPGVVLTEPSSNVHFLGAGAQMSTTTVRQSGFDLPPANTNGGTVTTSISAANYTIGALPNGTHGFTGAVAFVATWGSAVTGAALAALEAFGAALETASVPLSDATVIVAGQSNGAFLSLPPSWGWQNVSVGGTAIAKWQPGAPPLSGRTVNLYTTLANAVAAADPLKPVAVWWIQGEFDMASLSTVAVYAAQTDALVTALRGIRADLYWLDTLIHELSGGPDSGYPYAAELNVEKLSWIGTQNPALVSYLDPTAIDAANPPAGDGMGGLHWQPALAMQMMIAARDRFVEVYPP